MSETEQSNDLIWLTNALHEREQQNIELNNKLQRCKLQMKSKFAQLRQQIMNDTGSEDIESSSRLSSLLLRLDETEGQLAQFKEQVDDIKIQLNKKDKEKIDLEAQIQCLKQKLSSTYVGHKKMKTASFSSSDDDRISQLNDQIQQMYAQLVYKDSRIVELSRFIDEKDRKIMDLQETCREQNEVNKAKTKAIQIMQEDLDRFISKKMKDQAIQIDDADEYFKLNHANFANAMSTPGRAVAFYGDQKRKDEEESSLTTDFAAANDIEAFDLIRSVTKGDMNVDKLNNRLSGLLQEVEFMQRRVIENDAVEFEKSLQNSIQSNLIKKKKDKRVTFDFSEQQRLIKMVELREKLQKSDMACDNLRTENDEFRLTVADLSQRLDEFTKKNYAYESNCFDLKIRSENAERDVEDLKRQLEESKKECKSAVLKAKAQQTAKIKQLEEEIGSSRMELRLNSLIIDELENHLTASTKELLLNKEENDKIKTCIRNLTEELQQSYANVSRFEENWKKSESNLSAKCEIVSKLESLIKQNSAEKETLLKQIEDQKRNERKAVFKAKARLSVRVKELEETFINLKRDLVECEGRRVSIHHDYTVLEENFRLVSDERDVLLKQNQSVRKDFDELKQIIETSQEVIDVLENDLQLANTVIDKFRLQNEKDSELRRNGINNDSFDIRLKLEQYSLKLCSLQSDNERSDEELVALMTIE